MPEVPVYSCGNDQCASAAGAGLLAEGDAVCNFGTATVIYTLRGCQPEWLGPNQIAGIDARGNRTSTIYDAAGRSLANINPLNQRVTTAYDTAGEVIANIDPLNLLQVELLRRFRDTDRSDRVQRGIHISINGVASGLRNTG